MRDRETWQIDFPFRLKFLATLHEECPSDGWWYAYVRQMVDFYFEYFDSVEIFPSFWLVEVVKRYWKRFFSFFVFCSLLNNLIFRWTIRLSFGRIFVNECVCACQNEEHGRFKMAMECVWKSLYNTRSFQIGLKQRKKVGLGMRVKEKNILPDDDTRPKTPALYNLYYDYWEVTYNNHSKIKCP